jgi:single-strand DNA-binding protein
MGHLTRDPEIRSTPQGTPVADLGLALNEVTKNANGERVEKAVFVDVTVWSRQAEIAGEFLHKGSPVLIEGRLTLDTWDDRQTGQKRTKLKVVGENLRLVGRREQGQGEAPAQSRPASQNARPAKPARDPVLDEEPSDIPF